MKRIFVVVLAAFLVIILGAAGLYFLSRGQLPLSEPTNPQPPAGIPQGGPLATNPQSEPPQSPQGDVVRQQVFPLSDAQKASVLEIAQQNEIVSGLKERLNTQEAIVEEKGIRLPRGIVGTVIYIGSEWDMRIPVDIGNKEIISINIERHREKTQPQRFENLENAIKMAEKNPAVASRLAGKKYITNILPQAPEGMVSVGFIDRETKNPLFIVDIDPKSGEASIREVPQKPKVQRPQGLLPVKKTDKGGIEIWQGVAFILLVLLVVVLAYMYFSPKKK